MFQYLCFLQQNLRRSPLAVDEVLNNADVQTNFIGNCSILMIQEPALDSMKRVKGFPYSSTILSDSDSPSTSIIILSHNIKFCHLIDFTTSFCTVAKIFHSGAEIIICSIYFPPNCSITMFLSHIERILQKYEDLPVLLFGDFNCAHTRWLCRSDTSRGKQLLEFVLSYGLFVHETPEPSYRHLDGRSSHIDLLITNQRAEDLVGSWKQLPFGVYSDHSPQIAVLGDSPAQQERRQLSTWRFSENGADWEAFADSFCSDRTNELLDQILSCTSANDIETLIRALIDLIIDSAYKTLRIKKQGRANHRQLRRIWWNNDVRLLHGDVKSFKNRIRRCTSPVVRETLVSRYLLLKEKYEKLREARKNFTWKQYICDGDQSEAKTWGNGYRFIKSRMTQRTQTNQLIDGTRDVVVDNVRLLLKNFYPSDASTSVSEMCKDAPFIFQRHSVETFFSLIKYINGKKAPGLDGISNLMIRNLPTAVKLVLHNIVLKCMELGYFPVCWKEAAVRMIPKPNREDYTLPSSYRPISLTSNLSKLLEKIINCHLVHFLESHKVIHKHQYGFRAGRSTSDALQRIIDLSSQSASHSRKAIVSFDFKSAFDYAPHSTIIQGLVAHQAPVFLVAIISSYLSQRKVTTMLSDMKIDHKPEGRGCPQGGILSPTLWSLVMNSLLFELDAKGHEPTAYADDLTIVCQGKDDDELRRKVNEVALIVRRWSTCTGIPVNFDKSNALPLGQRSIPDLQGIDLKIFSSAKILGVTFVSSLKFDLHVKQKLTSTARYLEIVRRHFSKDFGLTCDTKCILFNCYVKPMLLYASEVWGNRITVKSKKAIATFENAVLRNAVHAFRSTSTDSLHVLTSVPFVSDLMNERAVAFENRTRLAPSFPNNPLFSKVQIINDNTEDSDLTICVKSYIDSESGHLYCLSILSCRLEEWPSIVSKYGPLTDRRDAVANSIRKSLKAVALRHSSLNRILILTHVPSCLQTDRARISKNTMKINSYLDSLDCRLLIKSDYSLLINLPSSFDTDRVRKISYTYPSLSTLKRELDNKLRTQLSTALQRCRGNVRAAMSSRKFHRRHLNQNTITFLSEHGPTREYLFRRCVAVSELCPTCQVSETYSHVALTCPRFQQTHHKFDIQRFDNTDELISSLIDSNHFEGFCKEIYDTLRKFNSSL